ncbi:hypothetical protein RUM44_003474 [Polyplax serrata]|uniref:Uncharacterized protein n=1 Tax=Polyplax serrata TaxID=468196 RepID=A0ABR1AGK1_POLSC
MVKTQAARASTFPSYKALMVSNPKPYVVHVELNRPEKMNAMDRTMWTEIGECFNHLSGNPDCRVIVLSGAGPKIFTAGIDLHSMLSVGAELSEHEDVARKSAVLWRLIKLYQNCISSLEKCPKPVLGAVHGPCIGGGLNLICATDIRYCTTDAWFQNKEVDIGMAADVGTLQRMPKVMGSASLVNELAFTCRKFPAAEAKETGFVSKVFDSKDSMIQSVLEVAEIIASKSPVAVQGTKRSLVYSRDHSVDEGLDNIALFNMAMLQSEDFLNAVTAQATKGDPPVFSKL